MGAEALGLDEFRERTEEKYRCQPNDYDKLDLLSAAHMGDTMQVTVTFLWCLMCS
jgi:hypothetical protein